MLLPIMNRAVEDGTEFGILPDAIVESAHDLRQILLGEMRPAHIDPIHLIGQADDPRFLSHLAGDHTAELLHGKQDVPIFACAARKLGYSVDRGEGLSES
jgi:hypothetical protein